MRGATTYRYDANGQVGEGLHGDGVLERFDYDSALNIAASGEHGPQALTELASYSNGIVA